MKNKYNYKKIEKYRKIEEMKEAKLEKLRAKDLTAIKMTFLNCLQSLYLGEIVSFLKVKDQLFLILENDFCMDEFEISCLIELLKSIEVNKKVANKENELKNQLEVIEFIFEEKTIRKLFYEYYDVKKAKSIKNNKHSNPIAHIISVGMGKK
jgi:hypothetical protein